ncbi:MAG: dimethyl sulfoxide reductase anchor subunit [bacterium]
MQKGFVFDINKCTGCSACRIACRIENGLDPGMAWREVATFNPERIPHIPVFHHSLACNHCADPPCQKSCPASAYSKDPVTGAVILDTEACIGCKYCSWACPFDAPKLNRPLGVMEKCTFCNDRLHDGVEPACVALCPTGALRLEDKTPARVNGVPGFPRSSVETAIRFVPLAEGRRSPDLSLPAPGVLAGDPRIVQGDRLNEKITLKTEWVLVVFSQIVAWLAGYAAAVLIAGARPHPVVFGMLGVLGLGVSALHLGKKERILRAVLNWRRSWLSREVILTSVFVVIGIFWLSAAPENRLMGLATVCAGMAGLFALDRVYHVTQGGRLNVHSAQTLITGLYAAALLGWNGGAMLAIGGLKLVSYLARKHRRWKAGIDARVGASVLRIVLGFAVPVGAWVWRPDDRLLPAVLCAAIGEAVDRFEFYLELDVPSPARQMSEDLAGLIVNTRRERAAPAHDGAAPLS